MRPAAAVLMAVAAPVPELVGQLVQLSALYADALYVPAAQADTLPPLPVYPASARQSAKTTLPVLVPVIRSLNRVASGLVPVVTERDRIGTG